MQTFNQPNIRGKAMSIKSDYHIHTKLCGHAIGEPIEYAQKALDLGLSEIGFSDHAPFVVHEYPGITMSPAQLPVYHKMIENVRDEFKGKIDVKVGIEADFIPGFEQKTKSILDAYPYDYIIGSVHFIGTWGFDDPEQRHLWDEKGIDEVYRDYYSLLRQSAESGFFNILAHVDLVKKYGHRSTKDMSDEIVRTGEVFKKTGVAIEINTSGLRKPILEIYPSVEVLSIYHELGVPITFGSDAHRPNEVGQDFDKAIELAKNVGYTEYVTFKDREISAILPF